MKSIIETETKKINTEFSSRINSETSFSKVDAPTNRIQNEYKYINPINNSKINNVKDAINFSKSLLTSTNRFADNLKTETPSVTESFSSRPFQYFNTYIVWEVDNQDMVFIDQHAAAEKILFEKLVANVNKVNTKPLLIPQIIDLKKSDKNVILEMKKDFAKIGIILDDFGGDSVQVTEIPELINTIDVNKYIDEVLNNTDDFGSLSKDYAGESISTELYNLLALTACHGSIRAGQKLSEQEMIKIIEGLKDLENPHSCPHGRPIKWKLKRSDIEKNFKRII
jgi:DNA mismatch repair protein MutL